MSVDRIVPQARAYKIIRNLNIRHPSEISIEEIAWTRGALVLEGGLRGADARIVHSGRSLFAIIRVRAGVTPYGRKRFAIAHELGHFELAHNEGVIAACSEKEFFIWYEGQNDREVEANIFAAELLMPTKLFRERLENTVPSMDLIQGLSDEFQTTLTATAIRYVELSEEPCAIVFSTGGCVRWVRRSSDFHYWISPGRKLSPYTCAAEYFEKGTISRQMETVRLDGWVENVSAGDHIREESIPMPSFDSVLSLLWRG